REREVTRTDRAVARQQQRAIDHGLELAHVARPVVRFEDLECFECDRCDVGGHRLFRLAEPHDVLAVGRRRRCEVPTFGLRELARLSCLWIDREQVLIIAGLGAIGSAAVAGAIALGAWTQAPSAPTRAAPAPVPRPDKPAPFELS